MAIIADIQHMFHYFLVRKDHRDFLHFLCYQDNDPGKEIVEYRMCVHVFGNHPCGFIAPVTIKGRLLLREVSMQAEDLDSPLPDDLDTMEELLTKPARSKDPTYLLIFSYFRGSEKVVVYI